MTLLIVLIMAEQPPARVYRRRCEISLPGRGLYTYLSYVIDDVSAPAKNIRVQSAVVVLVGGILSQPGRKHQDYLMPLSSRQQFCSPENASSASCKKKNAFFTVSNNTRDDASFCAANFERLRVRVCLKSMMSSPKSSPKRSKSMNQFTV